MSGMAVESELVARSCCLASMLVRERQLVFLELVTVLVHLVLVTVLEFELQLELGLVNLVLEKVLEYLEWQ